MNFRTTALLFGLVLGAFFLFGLMLAMKRAPVDESLLLPTLQETANRVIEIDTVQVIHAKDEPERFFSKKDGRWLMAVKGVAEGVRTKGGATLLIEQLQRAKKDEDTPLSYRPAEYGIEPPLITVIVKGREKIRVRGPDKKAEEKRLAEDPGKEREWKVFVGKESAGEIVYVATSDRPRQIFAVKKSSISHVFDDINRARSDLLITAAVDAIDTLTIVSKDKEKKQELQVKKLSANTWIFEKPEGYGLVDWEGPAPSKFSTTVAKEGLQNLFTAVKAMAIQEGNFVPLGDAPARYGLDANQETLSIRITGKEQDEKTKLDVPLDETLLVGRKEKIKDTEYYYVKMNHSPGIGKVAADKLQPILDALKNPGNLRSRDLLAVDTKKIDALRLKRGDDVVDLRLDKNWYASSNTEAKWRKGNKTLIDGLVEALHAKREIKEFKEEADDEKLGLLKPALVVDLWVGGIEKEEKKTDKKDGKDKKAEDKKDKKDDKDKKEEKADAKADAKKPADPKLKKGSSGKEAEATVRLSFGNVKDDVVYVKREAWVGPEPSDDDKKKDPKDKKDEAKKIVTRVAVPKSVWDKLTPKDTPGALKAKDPALAYVDPALPKLEGEESGTGEKVPFPTIVHVAIERRKTDDKTKVEKIELDRKQSVAEVEDASLTSHWTLKNLQDLAGGNAAASSQVQNLLGTLNRMSAQKWLQKYKDEDAEKLGFKSPSLSVTFTTKKIYPADGVLTTLALLANRQGHHLVSAPAALMVAREKEKGEKVTITFGDEVKDGDETYVYARHSGEGAADLVFLASTDTVKRLRDMDLRDKSGVEKYQGLIDVTLRGMFASPNFVDAYLAASPLSTRRLHLFDPAKVKHVDLVVRSPYEVRRFQFERGADKDKTWKETVKIEGFEVDSKKVNQWLEQLADHKSERLVERIVTLGAAKKDDKASNLLAAEYKFTDDKATVKLIATLESGEKVTLIVGASYGERFDARHFATTSRWQGVVFLTPGNLWSDLVNSPARKFGKDATAVAGP